MKVETFLDGRVTMLIGDVREGLASLEPDSFDCVPTSPPYWGLRDYGVEGQIGLERTLGEHLDVMVDVFRGVRRVLKPTGVCWINYGDCYATTPNGRSAADTKAMSDDDRTFRDKPFTTIGPIYDPNHRPNGTNQTRGANSGSKQTSSHVPPIGRIVAGGYLKSKDLCMIPERLYIALQDDGWWVRSKLPWIKRNGMPESVIDRPANSLEQVAMLTKSERYWYDTAAVRVVASNNTHSRAKSKVPAGWDTEKGHHGRSNRSGRTPTKYSGKPGVSPKSAPERSGIRANESWHASTSGAVLDDRNFRNTDLFFSSLQEPWGMISDADGTPLALDVNPQGFSEAHFATFPFGLVEPLIRASCPPSGRVLDPFGGAGTTAIVAVSLGRTATLIELNPEYARLARARIEAAFMGKAEGARHMVRKLGKTINHGPLFEGAAE